VILSDYECPTHGCFELMVDSPAPDDVPCPGCCERAVWVPFPVMGKVRMVEAARGVSDRRPGALAFDTRDLAEGMQMTEWKAKREKAWDEHRHKQNKELLGG
jgi:hypothetical protein